jgi:lysozyme family protein
MANYRKILEHVKTFEGGYSADPVDNASRDSSPVVGLDKRYPTYPVHTYRGVTWRTWKEYARRKPFLATGKNFVEMTLAQWEDLLKTLYWDAVLGDKIQSQGIAENLFEAVWGGGLRRLVIDLQTFLIARGYKIEADGAFGPKTLAAVNSYASNQTAERTLIDYLAAKRLEYLQGLDDWWKYRAGWSRRVKEVRDRAISYIGETLNENPELPIAAIGLAIGTYLLVKNA